MKDESPPAETDVTETVDSANPIIVGVFLRKTFWKNIKLSLKPDRFVVSPNPSMPRTLFPKLKTRPAEAGKI